VILLEALRNAPLCAASKRWPRVLHAVVGDEIRHGFAGYTVTAVCGTERLRLVVADGEHVLFPPSKAPLLRCWRCWVALARPRGRVRRRSLTRRAA
jgi:hypothetical protein